MALRMVNLSGKVMDLRSLIFGHTQICHPSVSRIGIFSIESYFNLRVNNLWVRLAFFPRTSFFLRERKRGFIRGRFAPRFQLLLRYSFGTLPQPLDTRAKVPLMNPPPEIKLSSCHPGGFSLVSWQKSFFFFFLHLRYDLQDLRATSGAFCALRHDGHVVCWGTPSLGGVRAGSAPIVGRSLVSTLGAFAVLRRLERDAAWVMNGPYFTSPKDGEICQLLGNLPCKLFIKVYIPWAPKTMKNKGFGHLKARLFTINTSQNVGFGGPWYPKTWLNFSIWGNHIFNQMEGWASQGAQGCFWCPY